MNKRLLLYVGVMFIGLYAMPNTVSLFAGQHTFYSGMGVSCDKCHSDIVSQVQTSGYVYEKHKDAAGNSNYTTYLSLGGKAYAGGNITAYNNINWTWDPATRKWKNSSNPGELKNLSLDTGGAPGIDGDEICTLCHNATLTGSVTHTGIVVRVCDDDRCHGNRNYQYGSPAILGSSSNITMAGYNLSKENIHQAFYLGAGNQSSRYAASMVFGQPGNTNGTSAFTSRGHWTCEGCHTETTINTTIIPAPTFNHSVGNPGKQRYN